MTAYEAHEVSVSGNGHEQPHALNAGHVSVTASAVLKRSRGDVSQIAQSGVEREISKADGI